MPQLRGILPRRPPPDRLFSGAHARLPRQLFCSRPVTDPGGTSDILGAGAPNGPQIETTLPAGEMPPRGPGGRFDYGFGNPSIHALMAASPAVCTTSVPRFGIWSLSRRFILT